MLAPALQSARFVFVAIAMVAILLEVDRNMHRKLNLAVATTALALAAACAQVPQQQIDAANTALESARTAEAADYAPEAWTLAQDAHNSAMNEVTAQNEKFG